MNKSFIDSPVLFSSIEKHQIKPNTYFWYNIGNSDYLHGPFLYLGNNKMKNSRGVEISLTFGDLVINYWVIAKEQF